RLFMGPRHHDPQRYRDLLIWRNYRMLPDATDHRVKQRGSIDRIRPRLDDPMPEQGRRRPLGDDLLASTLNFAIKVRSAYALLPCLIAAPPRVVQIVQSREIIDELLRVGGGLRFLRFIGVRDGL